ncbi:HPF/RaiA family ribosome-associated protein [Maribacter sp. ACAM166]|uniref:HPF/RaiA family ribosome-associated protein n=1 Tax=Maribacter sp. ACAM166 TaxID=2508996 RepID=UPI0010FE8FAB|nr:HPF/RaiA family ribosome-associated protein [Maribacter sp. ACAM166]TLP72863.1 HPF/RaiA family ribosome-associated protein [Maribacter sp. ACAM166]
MIIQINTDKTISGDKNMQEYFNSQVKESLERYQSHITRIEVHLKDENGKKDGLNDISCLLEARLEGRQPIVATNQADNIELALTGALTKIETAIETILGRIKNS